MPEYETNAIEYEPREWKDDRDGGTPIDATSLNRIEQGVADAVKGVNDVNLKLLTYLVESDGETATLDINGRQIAAPCYIFDKSDLSTWYDAGVDGESRVRPFASKSELDEVRDSLSQHEKGSWVDLYKSGDQYVKARKAGHFVTVCWSFKFDGISSWSCKLPEQFAPDSNHYAPAVLVNENNSLVNTVAMAAVYQEQIMFRSAAKADKCWHEGCFTYPV